MAKSFPNPSKGTRARKSKIAHERLQPACCGNDAQPTKYDSREDGADVTVFRVFVVGGGSLVLHAS